MCYRIIFLLCLVIEVVITENSDSSSVEMVWIRLSELFIDAIKNCSKSSKIVSNYTYNNIWYCLQIESLRIFDNIMSSNTISLMDGVQLIREHESNHKSQQSSKKMDIFHYNSNMENDDFDFDTWKYHVLNRISENISSYILQIDIKRILRSKDDTLEDAVSIARHRRYRNHMLTVMVFGVTALGMILVPMGFQFLAVLGGKALLLAKMALMLASISGLKKIATSGLHYGLYHVPEPPYPYGYYDRGDSSHLRQTNKNLFTEVI